jgi:ornithine carbamoyltransferase
MRSDIPESLRSIKHFLSIRDTAPQVLMDLVELSILRKGQFKRGELKPMLQGKTLAMVFQKASLRTRLGFEVAMAQLGGHAVNLEDHQIGVSRREDIRDIARVMSSMCDGIMARVFAHQTVVELAMHSTVPVVNGLSDWAHPCQALADLMTIREHFGSLAERKVAYIGDGNNVARSLMSVCMKTGMPFAMAAPRTYQLDPGSVEAGRTVAARSGASIEVTEDPAEAVAGADIVYTDVWTSMGHEDEREVREKAFAGFQVNSALLERAKPTAMVMHCLPAIRNAEISDELMESERLLIYQQAENRLHTQRALLEVLLGREN